MHGCSYVCLIKCSHYFHNYITMICLYSCQLFTLQPAVVNWFVYAFKIVHLIMLTHRPLPLNVSVLRIYIVLHSDNILIFHLLCLKIDYLIYKACNMQYSSLRILLIIIYSFYFIENIPKSDKK